MEDAATAEISRTQVWQWLKNQVNLEDGRTFNMEYIRILEDEVSKSVPKLGRKQKSKFKLALLLTN
jgi:malate synthase